MVYIDPYQCYFEERYDGVLFILQLHEQPPALDLEQVENYDQADYDSIDIESIIARYFELSLEPAKQQLYAARAVQKLRKAKTNTKMERLHAE